MAYCRPGALAKLMDGPKVRGFEVRPWLCCQCGACEDICRPGALQVLGRADLAQVADGVPTHILYDDWER